MSNLEPLLIEETTVAHMMILERLKHPLLALFSQRREGDTAPPRADFTNGEMAELIFVLHDSGGAFSALQESRQKFDAEAFKLATTLSATRMQGLVKRVAESVKEYIQAATAAPAQSAPALEKESNV